MIDDTIKDAISPAIANFDKLEAVAGGTASPTYDFFDNFDDVADTLLTAHTPDIDTVGTGWSVMVYNSPAVDGAGLAYNITGNRYGKYSFSLAVKTETINVAWQKDTGATATGVWYAYYPAAADYNYWRCECKPDGGALTINYGFTQYATVAISSGDGMVRWWIDAAGMYADWDQGSGKTSVQYLVNLSAWNHSETGIAFRTASDRTYAMGTYDRNEAAEPTWDDYLP